MRCKRDLICKTRAQLWGHKTLIATVHAFRLQASVAMFHYKFKTLYCDLRMFTCISRKHLLAMCKAHVGVNSNHSAFYVRSLANTHTHTHHANASQLSVRVPARLQPGRTLCNDSWLIHCYWHIRRRPIRKKLRICIDCPYELETEKEDDCGG